MPYRNANWKGITIPAWTQLLGLLVKICFNGKIRNRIHSSQCHWRFPFLSKGVLSSFYDMKLSDFFCKCLEGLVNGTQNMLPNKSIDFNQVNRLHEYAHYCYSSFLQLHNIFINIFLCC